MAVEKLAYSPQEVAEALGLSLNTVYSLLKSNKLKHLKLERRILVPKQALDELLGRCHEGHEARDQTRERTGATTRT